MTDGNRKQNIHSYFDAKAEFYDLTDTQAYWNYSDRLLWKYVEENLIKFGYTEHQGTLRILDAGAGTGRWSLRLVDYLEDSNVELFDLNRSMLEVAKLKFVENGLSDKVNFTIDDLDRSGAIKEKNYNVTICFHNVLSFVEDWRNVVSTLAGSLVADGLLMLVVPNIYHACYFSLTNGRLAEARRLLCSRSVKFSDTVPTMTVFDPSEMTQVLEENGLVDVEVVGFPSFLYPSFAETSIDQSSADLDLLLGNGEFVDTALELEFAYGRSEEAAARGNNLLVVGRKG